MSSVRLQVFRSGIAAAGLFLAAHLLLPCAQAGNRWARQSSTTMAWLHAVFFLDSNRGWAAGSKGVLLTTSDGGNTWRLKVKPSEDNVRDIYFADEENGWIVCEKNIYEQLKSNDAPLTYLMNTKDGGTSWNQVVIKDVDRDARLTRAVFNRGYAWVFGEGGMLFTSRDDGENWKRLEIPTRRLLLAGDFVDRDRGWIVGAGATIIQTSDGGDTWHQSRLADAAGVRFNAVSFVDNRIGWAAGAGGKIYRTINGGRTWEQQQSGVGIDLLDIKFVDAADGWACGVEGTLIHTSDGGLHWTTEATATTHPLERLYFADRNHGWAVGFGGTILTYVTATSPALKQ